MRKKIKEHLNAPGFIFDGFPRTVPQAEALDAMMNGHGLEISGMVALDVPDDELRSRLKERAKTSGRVDDQDEDKINNRIAVYHKETSPVADYYKMHGKYFEVGGVGTIQAIFEDIESAIARF